MASIKSKVQSIKSKITNAIKGIQTTSLPSQSASVYSAVKQSPVSAKQSTSAKAPVVNMSLAKAPQYTPTTGLGTKSGGYTYTGSKGWVPTQNAVLSTPVPKSQITPTAGARSTSPLQSTSRSSNPTASTTESNFTNNFGTSSFSNTSSTQGSTLGSGQSSLPKTNVVNNGLLKPTPELSLPEKKITEVPIIAPVVNPYEEDAKNKTKEKDTSLQDYLDSITTDAPSSEDAYAKAQKETDILAKQQKVNDLSGKLNSIVAAGEANKLSLIGQGRGIPEAIIGGQQAQIARETAIQALPIQAQLEAAQGNLEMANDNLDTLFKIYSDDAKNAYQYKKEVKKAIYDYASDKEKKALEKLDKMEDRAYQETKDLRKEASEYKKQAIDNGQASLAAKISVLAQDVTSPTYQEDFAKLIGQLRDPVKVAQLNKLNAEIAKLNAEANPRTINGVNEDLTAYASQYADTGKLPSPAELKLSGLSVGQVTVMAKQIPRGKGFVVSNTTGTKSNSISAEAEKDFQKLYNVTQMTKRLKELDKKRVGGLLSGITGKVFGSEDQGEYLTLRKAIVDEMSRMQSGAALTEEEVATYNDYLPGRYSETFFLGQDSLKKINNFDAAMNQKLENRLANNGLSIYGYSQVKVGNELRIVGDIVDIGGVNYRVLPDGNLTDIL